MSVHHLAAVADLVGIRPTCKLLLYALALDAGQSGAVVATYGRLIQLTGLSERALRDNIASLLHQGRIIRMQNVAGGYIIRNLS